MATAKAKFSAADVKKHTARIQQLGDELQKGRKKNDGLNVTVITPEEIDRKLKRVNSPFIYFQSWGGSVPVGGTLNYNVGIYNPDPTTAIWTFAHVWVGSGNVDPVTGTFLLNVDARFPRLTQPDFAGMSIPSGGSVTQSFQIKTPAGVEKTNYLGNTCLMALNWHDVGTYLDRSVFVFKVV
jgi:hypothetical protein